MIFFQKLFKGTGPLAFKRDESFKQLLNCFSTQSTVFSMRNIAKNAKKTTQIHVDFAENIFFRFFKFFFNFLLKNFFLLARITLKVQLKLFLVIFYVRKLCKLPKIRQKFFIEKLGLTVFLKKFFCRNFGSLHSFLT